MENSAEYADHLDGEDPISEFKDRFFIPAHHDGDPSIYLSGNSLGLQPKTTPQYIKQELVDWQKLGVEGHLHAKNPWLPYHEFLTEKMANVVGAKPIEVVAMNTLSVNLHLLMVSFYRPAGKRNKILIESDAFPSDRFAVESQLAFHGVENGLLEVKPRQGEYLLRHEDIIETIEEFGDQIALILLGCPNYYTGQVFDIKEITDAGQAAGCKVGFDLAHGAGNILLDLHGSNVDFAAWCTYKYLNSGPGSIGACFIHERYAYDFDIPRMVGWWAHNKDIRFNMRDDFDPIPGAEGWQLSNPPILSLAAIRASLDIFEEVGMEKLRSKSIKLTEYLEFLLLNAKGHRLKVITPANPEERGCQLSILIKNGDKSVFNTLNSRGIIADWREPSVLRVAPVPLYNTFRDVYEFVRILTEEIL